jgi:hypothetical protein
MAFSDHRARVTSTHSCSSQPVGLEGRDIVREPGSKLEDELRIREVRICPDLRYPAPMLRSAEERAHHRLVAKLPTPPALRLEQAGDHDLVVRLLRVLAVEANLQGEDRRPRCVLASDDLCLLVLARRLDRAEPDLDAVAAAPTAQLAELVGHQTPDGVPDIPEQ